METHRDIAVTVFRREIEAEAIPVALHACMARAPRNEPHQTRRPVDAEGEVSEVAEEE